LLKQRSNQAIPRVESLNNLGWRKHTQYFFGLLVMRLSICAVFLVAIWPGIVRAQDSGNEVNAYHGNGAEITVVVHDASGEPIAASALVSIYRDANTPSGQATTSRGSASFTVAALGEFVVVAEAPGYQRVEKDVSVPAPERAHVDVYLRRDSTAKMVTGIPGKPVLAPKARQMLDKALQALSTDDLGAAKKHFADLAKLAPSHPDVLYAQGVLYLKQHEWERAQSVLETATQIDPNHAQAFAALGMALSDQGKYAEAVAPLETALQLNAATGWDTHWTLAKAYYQQARYDDALKTSQIALEESKGKAPQIELLVAQSLTAVGKYEDAVQELREFLKEHGELSEATKARKWLEQLKASGKIK